MLIHEPRPSTLIQAVDIKDPGSACHPSPGYSHARCHLTRANLDGAGERHNSSLVTYATQYGDQYQDTISAAATRSTQQQLRTHLDKK